LNRADENSLFCKTNRKTVGLLLYTVQTL
jgi:hypothetical protein